MGPTRWLSVPAHRVEVSYRLRHYFGTSSACSTMLTMASGALVATAGPSEDRVRLVDYFAERFAGVPLDDYVYGRSSPILAGASNTSRSWSSRPSSATSTRARKSGTRRFATVRALPIASPTAGAT